MKIPNALLSESMDISRTSTKRATSAPPPSSSTKMVRPLTSVGQTSLADRLGFTPLMTKNRKEYGIVELDPTTVELTRPTQPKKAAKSRSQITPLTARLVMQPAFEDRKQRGVLLGMKQKELAESTRNTPAPIRRPKSSRPKRLQVNSTLPSLLSQSEKVEALKRSQSAKGDRSVNSQRPPHHPHQLAQLESEEIAEDDGSDKSKIPTLGTPKGTRSGASTPRGTGSAASTQKIMPRSPCPQTSATPEQMEDEDESTVLLSETQTSATSIENDLNQLMESTNEIRLKNEWQHILKDDVDPAEEINAPSLGSLVNRRNDKVKAPGISRVATLYKEKREINGVRMVVTIHNEAAFQSTGVTVRAFNPTGIQIQPLIIAEEQIESMSKECGFHPRSTNWCTHLVSRIEAAENGLLSVGKSNRPLQPIFDGTLSVGEGDDLHIIAKRQAPAQANAVFGTGGSVFLSVSEKGLEPFTHQLYLTEGEVAALSQELGREQVDSTWCKKLLKEKQVIQLAVLGGRARRDEVHVVDSASFSTSQSPDMAEEFNQDAVTAAAAAAEAQKLVADANAKQQKQRKMPSHGEVALGKKWMEHYLEEARVSRGPLKEAAMASAAALVRKLQEENSSEVASNAIVDDMFTEVIALVAEQTWHDMMAQEVKEKAATVIQSKFRSRRAQKVFVSSLRIHKKAAQRIQSCCRGRIARRKYRKRYMDELTKQKLAAGGRNMNLDDQLDEEAWQRHVLAQKKIALQQTHARLKLMKRLFQELAVSLQLRPPFRVPIDAVVRLFDDSGVLIGYGQHLGQEIAKVLEQVWKEHKESAPVSDGKLGKSHFTAAQEPTPQISWRELRAAVAVVMPDEIQLQIDTAMPQVLTAQGKQVERWMVKASPALKRACRHEREVSLVKKDEMTGKVLRELAKNVKEVWKELRLEQARAMWHRELLRQKAHKRLMEENLMRTVAEQIFDGVEQLKASMIVAGVDSTKMFNLLHSCGTYGNKTLLLAIEGEFNAFVIQAKALCPPGQGQDVYMLRREIEQELTGLELRCALFLLDDAHNNLAGTATEIQRQLLQEALRLPKESRQALHNTIPVVLRVALAREKVALLQKLTLGFVDEHDEKAIIVVMESCFDSVGTPAQDAERVIEGLSHVLPALGKTLLQQMLELMAGKEAIRLLQLLVYIAAASSRSNEWVMEALGAWSDTVHLFARTLAADSLIPCDFEGLEETNFSRGSFLTNETFWAAYQKMLGYRIGPIKAGVQVDLEKMVMLEAAAMDIQKVARGRRSRRRTSVVVVQEQEQTDR